MRADRLVAIVLLLQVHSRLTAAALAERLETSERTIRRDLEALSLAGIPVYPQRGRGGGWSLLGGHRIDLSGLTSGEAQALLVATGPGPAAALGPGVGDGLAAARRKVLAALPAPLRAEVEAAAAAILVDPSRWGPDAGPDSAGREPPGAEAHRATLRAAVLAGVQVLVDYEPPGRPAEERRLHPHGLVCKRGVWYLLATSPGGLRTYRLSRVRAVTATDDPAERPDGFDLAEAWAGVQRRLAARTPATVAVQLAAAPDALPAVRAMIGAWWPVEEEERGDDGRVRLTVRFSGARVAAAELASLGEQVEVVAPGDVRAELAELGRRLLSRYGAGGNPAVVPGG